jgi:hypothetical protein
VRFGATSADVYNIGGTQLIPTQIIVSRGTLQLDRLPADAAVTPTPFAQVLVRETGTLSLGDDARDFSKLFDLQIDDDSRIRVKVKPSDLHTSEASVKAADVDAIFRVRTIDTKWLGTGLNNKDRRLAIQLDLSEVGGTLAAGTWLKVVQAEDAIRWNNIHYLREESNTVYEDYIKVRPAIIDNKLDLTTRVIAHADENPYVIYLEVKENISGGGGVTPAPTPAGPAFDLTTSVATPGQIVATLTYRDDAGAPVADRSIKFSAQTGTDAPIDQTASTGANGVATTTFTNLQPGAAYRVIAEDTADATKVSAPSTITVTAPEGGGSSSGGGSCDAGFGAFALLAAAGVVVFRKKD